MASTNRYIAGSRVTAAANRLATLLPRWGIGLFGARLLAVRGRRSGKWRTTVVNILHCDEGTRVLVAPRGNTQWVRNLRATGGGQLRLGRHVEPFTATEIPDAEKAPLLRVYLRTWGWQVSQFFDGVTAASTDAEFAVVAPNIPVFRVN